MVREPGERARERPYSEIFRDIEARVERRHAELYGVPARRMHELPAVKVDRKAQQLAEKLADALDKGVRALDKW